MNHVVVQSCFVPDIETNGWNYNSVLRVRELHASAPL